MARIATQVIPGLPLIALGGSRRLGGILLGLAALLVVLTSGVARAEPLDQLSLDRWSKLRETERYQLTVAEKYYRDKQWKVALAEYNKFVQLYEKCDAASFALMKWALCQVELRQSNTAIKDGFKTVIDYWPDSQEAMASGYYLARTYRDIGEVKEAKKAYSKLITTHPKHAASIQARMDLIEIAGKDNDVERRVGLWKELVYSVERTKDVADVCVVASRQLAQHYFRTGDFAEGLKSLATTYKEEDLPIYLRDYNHGHLLPILSEVTGAKEETTKNLGIKVADAAVTWLRSQLPKDSRDEIGKTRAKQIFNYIAEVELAARRPEKQLAVYEEMVKAFGPDDAVLTSIGSWYVTAKRYEEARRVFGQFKNPIAGGNLIASSFRTELKYPQAIETYRKLAGADTKKLGTWLAEAAMTHREARQPDQAIAIYRELMTADATNASGWHWEMAMTLYHFGRWKEAITALRGTDRFPQNNQLMAQASRNLKQHNEAITLYRQIVAAHPPSASWALLQIAHTYEEAGQKDAAIKAFRALCERFPKSGEASQAHALLQDKYKINVTLGGTTNE